MKKTKPTLQFISPIIEGEMVSLDKYLLDMAKFSQTEYPGIKITIDHVRKLYQMILKDSSPTDDTPDEVLELFERMREDYEIAKEMLEEVMNAPKIEAEIVEPVKAVAVKEEPKSESLALIESVKDGLELSSFTTKFDIGAGMTQCVPRGEVEMKDWVAAFAFGLTLESGAQWIVGDSVVALENGGHEDVVNQLCSNFKKSYSTVSGYARACRAFPTDKRDPMLPFTVYRDIGNANFGDAKTNAKKQQELLDVAKNEKLSSTEVRNRVRNEQGKDVDKPTGHRFLLLNVGNFSNSEVLRTMPEEVQEHQLLIDLGDKSWFDPAEGEWLKFLKEQ
jgi:hypothetical protein